LGRLVRPFFLLLLFAMILYAWFDLRDLVMLMNNGLADSYGIFAEMV